MKLLIYLGAGMLLVATSCKTIKNVAPGPVPDKPHNAELLQVTEKTVGGSNIALTSDMKVIEPNSTLLVTVNKAALSDQLAGTQLSKDVTDKLNKLLSMLQQQQQAMQDVTEALLIYNKDPKNVDWQPHMKKLGAFVRLINNDPQTLKIYNTTLPPHSDIVIRYQTLFKTASIYLSQLEDQVQKEAKANGVYLQLGAWLDSKNGQSPIHIPGYDDYSAQPTTLVEQFQYTLSADQQKELSDISKLAATANQDGLGQALKDALSTNGGLLNGFTQLPSYKSAIAIQDTLENILNNTTVQLAALKAPVTDAWQSLKDYNDYLNATVKSFTTVSPTTTPDQLLTSVNNTINDLVTKTTALKTTLTTDANTIKTTVVATQNNATRYVEGLSGAINVLADSLQNDLTHLQKNISDLLTTIITGKKLTDETYDFTTKVTQLSLDQVLKPAVINLQTAGARDEGDMVTIKLATGKAGQPITEQALLQYRLYFCSLYARTATGFLFVNPVPLFKSTDGKALFRYSPSYSILLKGFWQGPEAARKNVAYHSLFNPGLGVNFAALTFNPNGTTELGIGGVFTLFQDFFQTGYGFDTVSGRGYMFFGFKIPVGSFTFQ